MSSNLKILVIRLSSIGDIVLTTPVIRCLKLQLDAEIDFLTKRQYRQILATNDNIRDILSFDEDSIIHTLRSKNYDFVIDKYFSIVFFKPYSNVSHIKAWPIDTSFIALIFCKKKLKF